MAYSENHELTGGSGWQIGQSCTPLKYAIPGFLGVLMMSDKLVFAYGSLVNSRARPAGVRTVPATLLGWVRQWMHCVETAQGKTCVLMAAPSPATKIQGLVLIYDNGDFVELDEREVGYFRVKVSARLLTPELAKENIDCYVYVGNMAHRRPGSNEFPIWRSYLDCILAGYLELGGRPAAEDFIATTQGWGAPILDDRHRPRYPRAVSLTPAELHEIDDILEQHSLLRNLVPASGHRRQLKNEFLNVQK